MPSEEALEDTETAAEEAIGCIGLVENLLPREVAGTMVCVEVVDSEEEEDNEGVGECDRGVGVVEGDPDWDLGRCEASVSACRAFSLDRMN